MKLSRYTVATRASSRGAYWVIAPTAPGCSRIPGSSPLPPTRRYTRYTSALAARSRCRTGRMAALGTAPAAPVVLDLSRRTGCGP